MSERRSLVEALKPTEAEAAREKAFVFAGKNPPEGSTAGEAGTNPKTPTTGTAGGIGGPFASSGRVPLTTRIRPELASAIKRVSLQRQLAGIHPHALQDLIEESLELWLLKNGEDGAGAGV